MSIVPGKAGQALYLNVSGMSWVELLPPSLPYTLKSLICVNPLCPDSFGWDGAFLFFFLMCLSRRKSNPATLYLLNHISTFVVNYFLFYFQLLCVYCTNHIICLCLNFLSAKELVLWLLFL